MQLTKLDGTVNGFQQTSQVDSKLISPTKLPTEEGIFTFLGTGTSQGIPVIGCGCAVCKSEDERNKRQRSAGHIQCEDRSVVIDTGADFRMQMLKLNPNRLDAVLLTHEHKDHIAGLDDIRPFNFKQQIDMPIYGLQRVVDRVKVEFGYAFEEKKYPGAPSMVLNPLSENKDFIAGGMVFTPLDINHYKLPILGFKTGNFAYITDAKTLPEATKDKIRGIDHLVINALQINPHISHLTLAEALALVEELKPKMCYFTHISHNLGLHDVVESTLLPPNVWLSYDGLQINIKVSVSN